jgi:hypothetical protein
MGHHQEGQTGMNGFQKAYANGIEEFHHHVMTTAQLAKVEGITPGRVRQLADRMGLGVTLHDGQRTYRLFRPSDIEAFQNRGDGRSRRRKVQG